MSYTPLRPVMDETTREMHMDHYYGPALFFDGRWISRQDLDFARSLVKKLGMEDECPK